MIAKKHAPPDTPIPWSLIEGITGRNLGNWDLGDAKVVMIKLPEREMHPTVAALNPVVFDAFDVRNLSRDAIRKFVTVRAAYELDQGRYVREALSGNGSVGCALSHYAVWQALAVQPDDGGGIIVLEDDARLLPPYTSIDVLLTLVHPNDEFLLLSSNALLPTINKVAGTRRRSAGRRVSGTRAYFLSRTLARALLDGGAWPINMHVDYYLRSYAHAHSGREMHTISGVVGVSTARSCLGHNNVRCPLKFRRAIMASLAVSATLFLIAVVFSAMVW